MRATVVVVTLVCLMPVALAACGSSPTYQSEARNAIATMKDAIATYNSTQSSGATGTSTGVANSAQACARALAQISGQSVIASPPANVPNPSRARALRTAYNLAIRGFTDCSRAAPYDYSRMARATQELQQADVWLARVRSLDH